MDYEPIHDLVLCEKIADAEKTSGGIIIPDAAIRNKREARVVAASAGARMTGGEISALMVKEGDIVVYTGEGIEVEIDEKAYVLLREGEIFLKRKAAVN